MVVLSNVKTDDLVGLFWNLAGHYKSNMKDFTPDSKLYVFYEGKFDTILELCMFLEFDDLLLKLEELKKV